MVLDTQADLDARLRKIEDELAVRRTVLSYGPAADAGLAGLAASLWEEAGIYDWDADSAPLEGRAAVEAMLRTDGHHRLLASGVAHIAGPPLISLDGDRATALTYSLIMRREPDGRYYAWRVSAAHWELTRDEGSWRVRRRTNRLLDDTDAGQALLTTAFRALSETAGS